MQFLGSTISLVSKSDIRYIGTLQAINTEESTISLSSVRSLGKEGRSLPDLPPSDTVYDFIVFRANDVKDLKIEHSAPEPQQPPPQPPMDPAIMSTGPQQQRMQQQPQQQPNQWGPPPPPGPPGMQPYGGYPYPPPPPPGLYNGPFAQQAQHQPWGPPPPMMQQQGQQQQQSQNQQNQQKVPQFQQPSDLDLDKTPIQTTTNSLPAVKEQPTIATTSAAAQKPTTEPVKEAQKPAAATQAKQTPAAAPTAQTQAKASAPVQAVKQAAPASAAAPAQAQASQQPTPAKAAQLGSAAPSKSAQPQAQSTTTAAPKPGVQKSFAAVATAGPALQAKTASSAATSGAGPTKEDFNSVTAASVERLAKDLGKLGVASPQQQQQPASTQKSNALHNGYAAARGGASAGGQGAGRGGFGAGGRGGASSSSVPRADFDFASSNEKFQKEKLSANASSDDVVIPAPSSSSNSIYNKASFFDNMSSDLNPQNTGGLANGGNASGAGGRFDRNEERSRNMATFGEAGSNSTGGFRGGYRRGGGYSRGGSGRGGYEGSGAAGRGRGTPNFGYNNTGRGRGRGAPRGGAPAATTA